MDNTPQYFYILITYNVFIVGYFMPNYQLFENIDSVLLFAVVGTVWNTIAIGINLKKLLLFKFFYINAKI